MPIVSDPSDERLVHVSHALKRIRLREDSSIPGSVAFPAANERELMQVLAEMCSSHVRQTRLVAGDDQPSRYTDELWRELAESGIQVQKLIVLGHAGLLTGDLRKAVGLDEGSGISVKVITASAVPAERTRLLRNQVQVDSQVTAVAPAVTGAATSSWTVTIESAQASEFESNFEDLWGQASQISDFGRSLSLEEPLVQSAMLISNVAPVLCSGGHIDAEDCAWYHGTWQLLRLMDLVSTPTWHHDFYSLELRKSLRSGARSVLITGTADYSVLAYVLDASRELGVEATVTVLDQCQTPLFASQWYAKREGAQVTTVAKDLLEYAAETSQTYDLIVTDAFLTRFATTEVEKVLSAWSNLLSSNGSVVTTVRAHAESQVAQTQDEAIRGFRERAVVRWRRWEPFVGCSSRNVGARAEYYARSMVSNQVGSVDLINSLLARHFEVSYAHVADVPGELYPTRYLRVRLRNDARSLNP
jgi:hypothetical protein